MHNFKHYMIRKAIASVVSFTFFISSICSPGVSYAQVISQTMLGLPIPGALVVPTAGFIPPSIKGMMIDANDPLKFNFIIDTGHTELKEEAFREEANKLIKYFMASLTVPEDEMWVNLSPYEKGRIIPTNFGVTEMGRDLLAQDYLLKQLTASLMNPDDGLGKEFWDRVHKQAYEKYGTTEIPINTFNKIWIVPDKAVIYEHPTGAFIVESHLKVMLEEDYLALKENLANDDFGLNKIDPQEAGVVSGVTSGIVKDILVPEIEKEVNEGKTFANLRQIFHSMILATWYKANLHESLLGQVYVDQNKVRGIDVEDKAVKDKIYEQYLEAFRVGVYDFIKEDYDPATQQIIPRKYFSGGFIAGKLKSLILTGAILSTSLGGSPQAEAKALDVFQNPSGRYQMAEVKAFEFSPNVDDKVVREVSDKGFESAQETDRSSLIRQAMSQEDVLRIARETPSWASRLDWKNASTVTWAELVRSASVPADESPQTERQENYFANQITVRRQLLEIAKDVLNTNISDDEFIRRMQQMHATLVTGSDGTSFYVSSKMDSADKTTEQTAKSVAGKFIDEKYGPQKLIFIKRGFEHFAQMTERNASTRKKIIFIADLYDSLINGRNIFPYGNHSWYMQVVNTLLRLEGLNPISQGYLDMLVLGGEIDVKGHFFDEVKAANPGIDIGDYSSFDRATLAEINTQSLIDLDNKQVVSWGDGNHITFDFGTFYDAPPIGANALGWQLMLDGKRVSLDNRITEGGDEIRQGIGVGTLNENDLLKIGKLPSGQQVIIHKLGDTTSLYYVVPDEISPRYLSAKLESTNFDERNSGITIDQTVTHTKGLITVRSEKGFFLSRERDDRLAKRQDEELLRKRRQEAQAREGTRNRQSSRFFYQGQTKEFILEPGQWTLGVFEYKDGRKLEVNFRRDEKGDLEFKRVGSTSDPYKVVLGESRPYEIGKRDGSITFKLRIEATPKGVAVKSFFDEEDVLSDGRLNLSASLGVVNDEIIRTNVERLKQYIQSSEGELLAGVVSLPGQQGPTRETQYILPTVDSEGLVSPIQSAAKGLQNKLAVWSDGTLTHTEDDKNPLHPNIQKAIEIINSADRAQLPTILIVDDDPGKRYVMQRILGREYDIVTASGGVEALEIIRQDPAKFRLVISDFNMPDLRGDDLVRALQQNEATAQVPVVIATGETQEAVSDEAIRSSGAQIKAVLRTQDMERESLIRTVKENIIDRASLSLQEAVQLSQSSDRQDRIDAVRALGNMSDPKAREVMEDMLTDVSPFVREEAAKSLGAVGNEATADILMDAIDEEQKDVFDENHHVRIAAIESLSRLYQKIQDKERLLTVLEERFAYDSDRRVSRAARDALLFFGEDSTVREIDDLRERARELIRSKIRQSGQQVPRFINHEDVSDAVLFLDEGIDDFSIRIEGSKVYVFRDAFGLDTDRASLYVDKSPDPAQQITTPTNARVFVFENDDYSSRTAREMADTLIENNRLGKKTIFGLATGGTQESVYAKLAEIIKREDIDVSNLITFNMDEYRPTASYAYDWAQDEQSYRFYMEKHLFGKLRDLGERSIKEENINFFNGQAADITQELARYGDALQKAMGDPLKGKTFGLAGLGEHGHFAFMEEVVIVDNDFLANRSSQENKERIRNISEYALDESFSDRYEELIESVVAEHKQARMSESFIEDLADAIQQADSAKRRKTGVAALAERIRRQPIIFRIKGVDNDAALRARLQGTVRVIQRDIPFEILLEDSDKEALTQHTILDISTIIANSRFFDDVADMPIEAFSIRTDFYMRYFDAVRTTVNGSKKAKAVVAIAEQAPSIRSSGSLVFKPLAGNPKIDVAVYADSAAAAQLQGFDKDRASLALGDDEFDRRDDRRRLEGGTGVLDPPTDKQKKQRRPRAPPRVNFKAAYYEEDAAVPIIERFRRAAGKESILTEQDIFMLSGRYLKEIEAEDIPTEEKNKLREQILKEEGRMAQEIRQSPRQQSFAVFLAAFIRNQARQDADKTYLNVYIPRDMAIGYTVERTLSELKEEGLETGPSDIFYVSRASMGMDSYNRVKSLIDQVAIQASLKAGYQDKEKLHDTFIELLGAAIFDRARQDAKFEFAINKIVQGLQEAGYDQHENIRFIDSGYKTFPLMLEAIVKYKFPNVKKTAGLVLESDIPQLLPESEFDTWQTVDQMAVISQPGAQSFVDKPLGAAESDGSLWTHPIKYQAEEDEQGNEVGHVVPTDPLTRMQASKHLVFVVAGALKYRQLVVAMANELMAGHGVSLTEAMRLSERALSHAFFADFEEEIKKEQDFVIPTINLDKIFKSYIGKDIASPVFFDKIDNFIRTQGNIKAFKGFYDPYIRLNLDRLQHIPDAQYDIKALSTTSQEAPVGINADAIKDLTEGWQVFLDDSRVKALSEIFPETKIFQLKGNIIQKEEIAQALTNITVERLDSFFIEGEIKLQHELKPTGIIWRDDKGDLRKVLQDQVDGSLWKHVGGGRLKPWTWMDIVKNLLSSVKQKIFSFIFDPQADPQAEWESLPEEDRTQETLAQLKVLKKAFGRIHNKAYERVYEQDQRAQQASITEQSFEEKVKAADEGFDKMVALIDELSKEQAEIEDAISETQDEEDFDYTLLTQYANIRNQLGQAQAQKREFGKMFRYYKEAAITALTDKNQAESMKWAWEQIAKRASEDFDITVSAIEKREADRAVLAEEIVESIQADENEKDPAQLAIDELIRDLKEQTGVDIIIYPSAYKDEASVKILQRVAAQILDVNKTDFPLKDKIERLIILRTDEFDTTSPAVDLKKWMSYKDGGDLFWTGKYGGMIDIDEFQRLDDKDTRETLMIFLKRLETPFKNAQPARALATSSADIDAEDRASLEKPDTVGGIDLNPQMLDLQIKRDANGVPLPLPQQPIQNMDIDGFIPVIINVTPVTNLPLLLGVSTQKDNPVNSAQVLTENEKLLALKKRNETLL